MGRLPNLMDPNDNKKRSQHKYVPIKNGEEVRQ